MITSLLWLAIELGVGIAVLVLCFVNKNAEIIIQDKLGNGHIYSSFSSCLRTFRRTFLLPHAIDQKGDHDL